MAKKAKYVVYVTADEVLVTRPKYESDCLKEWFAKDTGRELDDYDREEVYEGTVQIGQRMRVKNAF